MIFTVALLTSCVKLLLIPAYRSTDFEVHRNWLAITHSLPLKRWYIDDTSQWTLDYPPLFAYFEYILSSVAALFDKRMLNVENLNYESKQTILFQRLSVILTDLVYAYGAYKCCSLQKSWHANVVLPILIITNCGLLMIDHIHFQYNGVMYGVFLISVAYTLKDNYLKSAFWFTILLNMKHIYMYMAPAYFVYFLRNYCINGPVNSKNLFNLLFVKRLCLVGSIVLSIFFITFVPFYDQLGQVFARMFPFKRGLCHAYWAPNFWALYNVLDKVLSVVLIKFEIVTKNNTTASMTGGLVQEFSHAVLPSVGPIVTLALTALMIIPSLIKLWTLNKSHMNFLRCLVICALTSFLFGWHVHEKAILMAIIPLSVLAVTDVRDGRIFLLLSVVGHYSLFPLLYPDSLIWIKVLLLVLYSTYAFHSLSKIYPGAVCNYAFPLLNPVESLYILGLGIVFLYETVLHYALGLNQKLPYLPLMFTSSYCSLGVIYCWTKYYVYFLRRSSVNVSKKVR